VLCCANCRRDGAVEEILRMPMPGPVVVGRFDHRGIGRGVCEVGVRIERLRMVMVTVMKRVNAIGIVVVAMLLAIEVDVQTVAAGVVVEVEPGARRHDRRHKER